MYFVVMFGCCSMFISLHLDVKFQTSVNRRPVSYLNRLPFPNRNSDSGILYIIFKRFSSHLSSGTLGFPIWGQVHAFPVKSCICIPHRIPHSIPSLHHIVDPCTWLIVLRLLVCLVWVDPGDDFANEEPVEFAFEDPVNSDNFVGKMIIPSKSLLSLLC